MNNKFYINTTKALKRVFIVYAILIVIGIVLTAIFGLDLDINFKGGTRISYSYTGTINNETAKATVEKALGKGAAITYNSAIGGKSQQMVISLPGNTSLAADKQDALSTSLSETFKDNKIELYDSNSVSPTVAGSFFLKSLFAVLLAGVGVVIYVGIRFRKIGGVSAALMAYVALIIDCIIAFLSCTAFRLQIDSNLIAVVLTLLGYSLNDTIVIYDRVREERKFNPQEDIESIVDRSINTVKTRTIMTTVTTVLAVITIIVVSEIYGLKSLRSFAIPMAFGLLSGCVTSLLVAGPLWVRWIKFKASRPVKAKKK